MKTVDEYAWELKQALEEKQYGLQITREGLSVIEKHIKKIIEHYNNLLLGMDVPDR